MPNNDKYTRFNNCFQNKIVTYHTAEVTLGNTEHLLLLNIMFEIYTVKPSLNH